MASEANNNKLLDDDDWGNLLLKLELDLRSQFFFIAYLQSVRSSISPKFGGELALVPTITDYLQTCERLKTTKSINIPAQYIVDAYHYILEDLTRLKIAKKKMLKYDYLTDVMLRSTRDLPPTVSFEDQLETLGGFEIYSVLVGDQSIRATWHGQLRLRPDSVEQSLDVLLFRYKPNPPHYLYKVRQHKCTKVANFLEHDLPKYEASRLLRIAIPVDHIGGIHFLYLPYSMSPNDEKPMDIQKPAVLGIDIIHPVNFYTRRVNCTHPELNEWKERDDFTRNRLGSTYTRYLFCGTLENLFKTVGVLVRFRPHLRHKILEGISDITTVSIQQFGPSHAPPVDHHHNNTDFEDNHELKPEVLEVLIKNNVLDRNHTQKDYPLDGYDVCFQDFLANIQDPVDVDEILNSELPEVDPHCKLKEYMMDHRGLTGSHYSFCKGRIVGDDTYHCKKCKICAGLDHWHTHRRSNVREGELVKFVARFPRSHKKTSIPPCAPEEKKFLYPIPLSGKLHATHSDRPTPNERGSASGEDDMDEPSWAIPKPVPDAVDTDWIELSN